MPSFATPFDIVRDIQQRAEQLRSSEIEIARRQMGPLERWHTIGAASEPSWMNGFGDTGGGTAPPGFFLDTAGFTHFRGRMSGASAGTGVLVSTFILPAVYRPPALVVLTNYSGALYVQTDGAVRIEAPGTATVTFYLDGLRFRTV